MSPRVVATWQDKHANVLVRCVTLGDSAAPLFEKFAQDSFGAWRWESVETHETSSCLFHLAENLLEQVDQAQAKLQENIAALQKTIDAIPPPVSLDETRGRVAWSSKKEGHWQGVLLAKAPKSGAIENRIHRDCVRDEQLLTPQSTNAVFDRLPLANNCSLCVGLGPERHCTKCGYGLSTRERVVEASHNGALRHVARIRPLTPLQQNVWKFICSQNPKPSAQQVADHFGKDIRTARMVIAAIARRGYVRRHDDPSNP